MKLYGEREKKTQSIRSFAFIAMKHAHDVS